MSSEQDRLSVQIRVMQIIAMALMMGMVIFLSIALFAVQQQGAVGNQNDVPILTYMALGAFLLQILLALFIPKLIGTQQAQKIALGTWSMPAQSRARVPESDPEKLALVYQTSMIVAYALLEGAAFFAIIAYMIEAQIISLIVVGLLLLFMMTLFPTRVKVQNWIDRQLGLIDRLRSNGTT